MFLGTYTRKVDPIAFGCFMSALTVEFDLFLTFRSYSELKLLYSSKIFCCWASEKDNDDGKLPYLLMRFLGWLRMILLYLN
jgi:hypothetical protein